MLQKNVLFAGHDFKFINGFINYVRAQGWNVRMDKWFRHSRHNWFHSIYQLQHADVIFCEWGLGNAVWYARHKRPSQRLIVRVHAQEVRGGYLAKVPKEKVDSFVFVSDHLRRAAINKGMVGESNSVVIPNAVDTRSLAQPKLRSADRTIAMVGYIPKAKRLDLALDLISELRKKDPTFRLVLKGKRPEELKWLRLRDDEMEFFKRQDERIAVEDLLGRDAVGYSKFSPEMASFYAGVGHIISLSDYESFHLGLAEGAASGAVPSILRWEGSEDLYPSDWICESLGEMTERIVNSPSIPDRGAMGWVRERYDVQIVYEQLVNMLRHFG
ncbi:glycosyltransferase family 4 protein [Corynebacterium sp. HMSC078C09]|uniref:glycosyltransferase family 4 protein n=1 Tax=Corynebacterium sp. HMSC078C09 TaxID=1739478 RepID=UPI0008C1A772|nr:glycosyltransferase family 4 protein [Corynebacterium sp. HMSC078C09]OFP73451.1 hypothetical protein HMPREF2974_07305 [Corynebacterium sp. HMSC078C09]